MFTHKILIFIYFLFCLMNLSILKQADHQSMPSFMITRGLVGIFLSVLMYRITEKKFKFSILKHTRQRVIFGGLGMSMQVFGASHIPISLYGLMNRATPAWFSMLIQERFQVLPTLIIATATAAPWVLQSVPQALYLGIFAMCAGTFLVALSQKSQVQGAKLESKWLMPFAPSLGLSIVGFVLWIYTASSFRLVELAIISGMVMSIGYWFASAVITRSANGSQHMVLCDLMASVVLGSSESIQQNSSASWIYLVLTLASFAVFSERLQKSILKKLPIFSLHK
jgi:hypothetical protein